MRTTNYRDTLILPSPDCPALETGVPQNPGTNAERQFQKLSTEPYGRTSDDLLFEVYAERHGIADHDRFEARTEFFMKSQACLRSSPLVKTLGWALHHDAEGRVALVDPASETFQSLMGRDDITKRFGLRSRRA